MIAYLIVFAAAVAVVVTYMLIVNRFLRSDENWNESSTVQPPQTRAENPHGVALSSVAHG
jgi:hypothetical protein